MERLYRAKAINKDECATLALLRRYFWEDTAIDLRVSADWEAIEMIARRHMVLPLILESAMALPPEQRPPEEKIKAWKSAVIQTVLRNEFSMRAQAEIVNLLAGVGIPCAVMKGASVAALYPKPELRTLGDIDILVSEATCEKAAELLEANGYRKHESDHAFHIGFHKANVYLELHYAVTEFPDSHIGNQIKERLNSAVDRVKTARIEQYGFPVLTEADQSLCLLLHMERHMISGGIGLRQLCDWRAYIDSLEGNTLQSEIFPEIRECRLYQFASILTKICLLYMGLDAEKHRWCMHVSQKTADELLVDILDSGNILSRSLERNASSTFIKGEDSADGKQFMLSSAVRNLTKSSKKQFPISVKLPLLMPLFWVYIPVRYLYRSMKGTRPKQSVRKIAQYAMKRKRLYRKLELFKN